jgi:hypothetical protein
MQIFNSLFIRANVESNINWFNKNFDNLKKWFKNKRKRLRVEFFCFHRINITTGKNKIHLYKSFFCLSFCREFPLAYLFETNLLRLGNSALHWHE